MLKRTCVLTKITSDKTTILEKLKFWHNKVPTALTFAALTCRWHKHLHVYSSGHGASWDGDEQTAGRRAAAVSYGSSGDRGPGLVLSSTRGMGQLKEPSPRRTTSRALLAEL